MTRTNLGEGASVSNSILQLHEIIGELRSEIRELRDRVAILEIGAGETIDPAETNEVSPTTLRTTTTSTTTTRSTVCRHNFFQHFLHSAKVDYVFIFRQQPLKLLRQQSL